MRVLLDENLPHDLIATLAGHTVVTVQGMGWAGVQNGELLRLATGHVDVFVTMDRRLPEQHKIATLSFGVVLLVARSNRVQDLLPLVPDLLAAVDRIKAGLFEQVGT